jgi:hypothetical protein
MVVDGLSQPFHTRQPFLVHRSVHVFRVLA